MSVLDSLLNEESLNSKQKSQDLWMDIVYIPRDKIKENELNKEYSINGIDALKQSILLAGLEQPLVVRKEGDFFVLLTGHRRFKAICELIDSNQRDELIPCLIKDTNKNDLPLSEKSKEMLSILSTNCMREKTEGDYLFEIREWKKIFKELRNNDIEFFDFSGELTKIKGTKTRTLLADATGLSESQVRKYEALDNSEDDELIEDVVSGKITLNKATKKMNDDIDTDNNVEIITSSSTKIDLNKFKRDIMVIEKALKNNHVFLDNKEYSKYLDLVTKLEKIIIK